MVTLEQHKPKTILGYVREVADLNGLPKAIPKTGRLRHHVRQLNMVTRSYGENPAAVERLFRDKLPVTSIGRITRIPLSGPQPPWAAGTGNC